MTSSDRTDSTPVAATPMSAASDADSPLEPADYPELTRFLDRLSFGLDPFQLRACSALENGHGVLVCAPTGAGKTIVGEFAVHLALEGGTKCFYTTPIKALSNQKYADLVAVHGRENIGLLTGDSSINPDAPVVVMTTEVVRNMLYANSPALQGLSHVVMDEVHYLADRFRGAVWEEVILHLAPEVKVVSLSATVSNAEEFGEWIQTVRGDTTVVVDEHRPVPLSQHMLVGSRLFDLYAPSADNRGRSGVNPALSRYIRQRAAIDTGHGYRGRPGPPSRPDIVAALERAGLLPAIDFIFSRAGCDAALTQCRRSGLNLLSADEAAEVDRVVDDYVAEFSTADEDVLGVAAWRSALRRGFAAHHAGMLPTFRHAVEELFVRGLVKVVFATETLALGINMPARSVVLERLVKYNGEAHVDLTPGEYTQLTGRAGRRGIDVEGHAVVVWSPEVEPNQVAGLAGARTFPLRSSFAPGYNMAVNLIGRLGIDGARNLLDRSFAQFQADRSVVGQSRKVDAERARLRALDTELATLADERGVSVRDFTDYMDLREQIKRRERELKYEVRAESGAATVEELNALKRGHVIALHGGKHRGLAVVLEPAGDHRDPKPLVLTTDAWSGRIGVRDFVNPPEVLGHMRLARHVDRRTGRGRRDIASALRSTGIEVPRGRQKKRSVAAEDHQLLTLRSRLREHRLHSLRGNDELFRLAERRDRLQREISALERSVTDRTDGLRVDFDRIVAVLDELGYIGESGGDEPSPSTPDLSTHDRAIDDLAAQDGRDPDDSEFDEGEFDEGEFDDADTSTRPDGPGITDAGRMLTRIYSESDLLICECIRSGIWNDLAAPELAGVVAAVVYESRRDAFGGPELVTRNPVLREALVQTHRRWRDLAKVEARHSVSSTREPDAGFSTAAYAWASGRPLAEVLALAGDRGKPLPAGDFVRWSRQVVDLLEQIRLTAAPGSPLRTAARKAVNGIRRGVVAAELG